MTATPPDLPPNFSVEYLANIAVENGEGGAQQMIVDKVLHQSIVANVRKQMQRLEAHARADERHKARAELIAELHAYADRQYCIGIEQMRRPECLGWEAKVKTGRFGEAEFGAHARANKAFGAHFGIYEAIKGLT